MLPTSSTWVGRVLVIPSLAGVVLFFPLIVCRQHTCLFEHLMTRCKSNGIAEDLSIVALLRHYLFPYALFWWLSIIVMVLAVICTVRHHSGVGIDMKSPKSLRRK